MPVYWDRARKPELIAEIKRRGLSRLSKSALDVKSVAELRQMIKKADDEDRE